MTKKKTKTARTTPARKRPAKAIEPGERDGLSPTARDIYAVVRAIPRGKVATYGQIGELIGMPAGHRIVARAMRTCPSGLPWQRVVGKKDARRGGINVQDPEHAALQRNLLEREGVHFDRNGYIVLNDSGWLPR